MSAAGGVLGAVLAGRIQTLLTPPALLLTMGCVITSSFALLIAVENPYAIGTLLAVIMFVAAPANGLLYAAQIQLTPPHMQGRVLSAAVLLTGVTAPLGPLVAGLSLDNAGRAGTFTAFAAVTAVLTIVMWLSRPIRSWHLPNPNPDPDPHPHR